MVEAAMLLKAPTRPVNRSGNRIASCATRSTTPTLRSATRKADSKSVMLLAPVVAPATVAFSITSATRDQPFSRARKLPRRGRLRVMTQAAKRMASVYRSISTVCSLRPLHCIKDRSHSSNLVGRSDLQFCCQRQKHVSKFHAVGGHAPIELYQRLGKIAERRDAETLQEAFEVHLGLTVPRPPLCAVSPLAR